MASRPIRRLVLRERTLELGERPLVMGILNATPDSFYDGGAHPDLEARVRRGEQLLAEGRT
jgi:dihydropteroate synthase